MRIVQQETDVELYGQHQQDSTDRPSVFDKNLLERTDSEQDIPPLGQDLNGDVDQENSRVKPEGCEDQEPAPVPGFQAQAE